MAEESLPEALGYHYLLLDIGAEKKAQMGGKGMTFKISQEEAGPFLGKSPNLTIQETEFHSSHALVACQ
ncbi:hypothetical protein DTL21_09770 [Bremerella cremea]|uniref:Uncharacterized protein n=1 Tax=Blastopirellula marina TaxID=124 RepID=A0A2S8FVH5_9BACT|nr:hypothetical protein C5Y83_09765 [Blastopirellula marina]RCS48869.1 hypothetical protein DTL21_09770 [Bremerella cremea]